MFIRYRLWRALPALTSNNAFTEIPSGSVVEAPAMIAVKGTVKIRYGKRLMTVLALDFLDSALADTDQRKPRIHKDG